MVKKSIAIICLFIMLLSTAMLCAGCIDKLLAIFDRGNTFAKDDLEAVKPYVFEERNYTVKNGKNTTKLSFFTYITKSYVAIETEKYHEVYSLWLIRMNQPWLIYTADEYFHLTGTMRMPSMTADDVYSTYGYSDLFELDWIYDEGEQIYRSENKTLEINRGEVSIKTYNEQNEVIIERVFYDFGTTKYDPPQIMKDKFED